MYAIFRVWLYAIISAGVDSTTDVAQVKRIKLSNVFSLFGITGFLFFILLISFFKWWLVVGFQMVFVVLFCLCILLNYYKKYNLSRFLYILSFAGFILFFGWLDYTHTIRVHYYLFILPLMIFVMFEVRQSSALIVAFTIVVATFVAINEIDSPLHFHNYSINDRVITIMHLINVLFIFFILSFIAFHFGRAYNNINESLISTQKQLSENHALAKAGNWYFSFRTQTYRYSSEMKDLLNLESVRANEKNDLFSQKLSPESYVRYAANKAKAIDEKISVDDDYEINNEHLQKYFKAVLQPVLNVNGAIRGLQGVCIDVTEQQKVQLNLEEHLREKEVVLNEIHHRISYNLNLVIDFIRLQMDRATDVHVKQMLEVCRQRIAIMSLIHEKIYAADNEAAMFDDYLRELISGISKSLQHDELQVNVTTELESFQLMYNSVLPCGLIINELMTNSWKHAFKGRNRGQITIKMKKENDVVVITYHDDGTGMEVAEVNTGIGIELIQSLTQQLKGMIMIKNQNGFMAELRFKTEKL